jgi:PLAT/LH2 domain-containing protein
MARIPSVRTLPSLLAIACCVLATPALAFDTGPHFDITEDVLRAEGFSDNAIRTAQCANFMIDFHEFMRKDMFKKVLDPNCRAQLEQVMQIADELQHFDDLDDVTQVAHRWDSMIDGTQTTSGVLMKAHDTLGLLTLLGASLHNVQDFYAHSNWVDMIGKGTLAPYGTHPTWLTVDRPVREGLDVFTRREKGTPPRTHGDWNSNANALNQDWSGRPHHCDAYRCAWFATRQWVRLFKTFVDASTWNQMQQMSKTAFDPEWDWEHARKISFYGGHWNGNGGPTGLKNAFSKESAGTSPDLLLNAVLDYMGYSLTSLERPCITKKRTLIRFKIESLLRTWGSWPYKTPMNPTLPSAAPDSVTFVRLRVEDIVAIAPDDGIGGGEQDWYGRGRIGGQRYWTGLIDEHNNFDFKSPYAPWALIKGIQPGNDVVNTLVVRLRTGSTDGAGTDDNMYLWLSDKLKIEFPYDPDEDDFENSASYDYSFKLPPGTRLGDITRIRIEKSSGDDYQIGGVSVAVNDQWIYRNEAVNSWLNDRTRIWEATDYRPGPAAGSIPLHFDLMELDYSTDDRADINPKPKVKSLFFDYSLASGQLRGDVTASPSITLGTEGSDRARIKIEVDRLPGSCRASPAKSAGSTGP